MANVSFIKLPDNQIFSLKDSNAMPYSGGAFTGAVTFNDSLYADDANVGSLIVRGSGEFVNNLNVGNTIKAQTFIGALTGTASGNLTANSLLDATKLTGKIPAICFPEDLWTDGITTSNLVVEGSTSIANSLIVGNRLTVNEALFKGTVLYDNSIIAEEITTGNLISTGSISVSNNMNISGTVTASNFNGPVLNNTLISESEPTASYEGQFWINPITSVIKYWDGHVWSQLSLE